MKLLKLYKDDRCLKKFQRGYRKVSTLCSRGIGHLAHTIKTEHKNNLLEPSPSPPEFLKESEGKKVTCSTGGAYPLI